MKLENYDGHETRQVLVGLITDPAVLAPVAAKWDPAGMFADRWADLVGGWCVDYYNRHNKAPNKDVQGLFRAWARRAKDPATVESVDRFLASLSEEYKADPKERNGAYTVDVAGRLFNRVAVTRAAEAAKALADQGRVEEAEEALASRRKVELGAGVCKSPLNDRSLWDAAFSHATHPPVITYPGAIGRVFNGVMVRGGFVAIQAPDKTGKCLHEDAKILLADGTIRTIKDIVRRRRKVEVVSYNEGTLRFEKRGVVNWWDNGAKVCWRITTKTGRVIEITDNHPLLTPDGWKALRDIYVGEHVAVPKKLDFFGTTDLPDDEIKFLAYMLADGSCVGYNCGFTKSDPALVEGFLSCCRRLGFIVRRGANHYYGLRSGSESPRSVLRYHGVQGKRSKEKEVPKAIFSCTKEKIALFLRVFISCDGWIQDGGRTVHLTLASERMLRQIGHLLLRFGVVHNIVPGTTELDGKVFPHWTLNITAAEYVNRFASEIGLLSYKKVAPFAYEKQRSFLDVLPWQVASKFHNEVEEELGGRKWKYILGERVRTRFHTVFTKARTVRERIAKKCNTVRQSFNEVAGTRAGVKYLESDVLWDKVESVACVGKKRTYDIEVEGDWHNFVASDFVVHNSMVLLDACYRAVCQRSRVLYLECGDLGEEEFLALRLGPRLTAKPIISPTGDWPCHLDVPVRLEPPAEGEDYARVIHKRVTFRRPLDVEEAWKACVDLVENRVRSGRPYLRFAAYPAGHLKVADVHAVIREEERRHGWTPDVVVLDYADILAAPDADLVDDSRTKTYENWLQLRALAQSWRCLVLTATQSNAAAYDAKVQSRRHFSDSKGKNAHASAIFALNVTAPERDRGQARVNQIVRRHGYHNSSRVVHVAGCAAIGNPFVCSVD